MDNQQQNCNLTYNGNVISKDHLEIIYNMYISGSSLSEISKTYKYNIGTIRNFLKTNKVKIRTVKESVEKFHKQETIVIDEFLNDNLIGWLLGDGGLRKSKHSINPVFTYTDKHQDYILYVSSILDKYGIKYSISQNRRSGCYQLQTETRPEFNKYYDLFYGYEGLNELGQKRKILPDIKLTPIILRNWFIGDGSSVKLSGSYNHRGSISCKFENNFILEQLNIICNTDKIKIYSYKSSQSVCYQYHIPNSPFIKFLDYIGECPVESYKYKWITRCSTTIIEASENQG